MWGVYAMRYVEASLVSCAFARRTKEEAPVAYTRVCVCLSMLYVQDLFSYLFFFRSC